jgi:ABC-type tungstate transport system permease subunit
VFRIVLAALVAAISLAPARAAEPAQTAITLASTTSVDNSGLLAAILLGVSDTAGKYLYADAGGFIIYAVAVLVLLLKPAGLYGRE